MFHSYVTYAKNLQQTMKVSGHRQELYLVKGAFIHL